MKKLYILTVLILLTGFGTAFAQTLKGHIYDANTNEPLVGAAVTYKLHGNQGVEHTKSSCPKEESTWYSAMWDMKMFSCP